jgi:hypothetical protein
MDEPRNWAETGDVHLLPKEVRLYEIFYPQVFQVAASDILSSTVEGEAPAGSSDGTASMEREKSLTAA